MSLGPSSSSRESSSLTCTLGGILFIGIGLLSAPLARGFGLTARPERQPTLLHFYRKVGTSPMDHQVDFKLLVMKKLKRKTAEAIDWSAPRLLCVARDFTKYNMPSRK
jgi:hypothetical protein